MKRIILRPIGCDYQTGKQAKEAFFAGARFATLAGKPCNVFDFAPETRVALWFNDCRCLALVTVPAMPNSENTPEAYLARVTIEETNPND